MGRLSNGQKAVIALAILVIIGLLGGVIYLSGAVDKLFHKSKPVSFAFAVKVDKGLDKHATPVIAHIQGMDASNKHVDVYKVLSFESNALVDTSALNNSSSDQSSSTGTHTSQLNQSDQQPASSGHSQESGQASNAQTSTPSSQDAPASGSDSSEAAGVSASETAAPSFEEIDRNPGAYAISYISPINPDGSLYEVSEPQTIDTNIAQPMVIAEATMTYRAPETVSDEELSAVISEIEKATHVSGEEAQIAELQMVLDQAQQVSTNKQVMAEALKEASDKQLQALSGTVKMVHSDDEYYALLGEEKPTYTSDSKIEERPNDIAILVLSQPVKVSFSYSSSPKDISAVELENYPKFFSKYVGKDIMVFVDKKKMEEIGGFPSCMPNMVVVKGEKYEKTAPSSDLPVGNYFYHTTSGVMTGHMARVSVHIDDNGIVTTTSGEMTPSGARFNRTFDQISPDASIAQKQGCQSYRISGKNEFNALGSAEWYYNPSDKTFTTNKRDSFVLKLAE